MPLGNWFEGRLPWHGAPQGGERVVIRYQDSDLFAKLQHPTTHEAVIFLEAAVPRLESSNVLDFGSGTGILVICAAHLGASAVGVETDTKCIRAARRTVAASRSRCSHIPRFTQGPRDFGVTAKYTSALAKDVGFFDVLVADMSLSTLALLAPAMAAAARPGAMLALTGLRQDQYHVLRDAYEPCFENLCKVPLEIGWLLIEARRRRPSRTVGFSRHPDTGCTG